ncbi:hypothetical protein ACJJJB_11485 [Microbulbifer sp. ANSA001]|uniref:hypothetical protein n=1 Tax=Microbulbifer sp. ANSA001 TaxID=3243358 RepID=UPI00404333E6
MIARLLTFLALIFSGSISAQIIIMPPELYEPNVYWCNNCESYQNKANEVALDNWRKKYYIIDTNNDVIKAYIGVNSSGSSMEPDAAIGQPSSVDSEFENLFDNLMIAYIDLSTTDPIQIPAEIGNSAWDMSGKSKTRNDIADYLSENIGLRNKIGNYATAATEIAGIIEAEITVTIVFVDGSSAKFKISEINNNQIEFEYIEGSAKDANNNSVPTTVKGFAGTFVLETPEQINEFLQGYNNWGGNMPGLEGCKKADVTCEVIGDEVRCVAKSVSC